MEIKILGSGCSRCKKTFETVKLVIEEDNVKANVEYVTDIAKILDYNIMSMPAIVIDDKVVLNGSAYSGTSETKWIEEVRHITKGHFVLRPWHKKQ